VFHCRAAGAQRSAAVGILLALAAGFASAQPAGGDAPPPAVTVAAVTIGDVDRQKRFIGSVKAIQSVDLKARVEGFLEDVAFEQGSMVEQGATLYQIEQAPYQADVDSAEGQLAAAKAELDSAQASLEDKQADFERQATLIKKGDTSQTAFDAAKAQRDEAKANVEKAKASIQQAKAAVATAKINLGYTTVASPIAGRIGATAYTKGNLVGPSSSTLATVVQLDPIRAVFSIPSADFVRIQERIGNEATEKTRAAFVPELILPTGDTYARKGSISFADNQVDTATGTVAIYADFPNPKHVLLPGQFVTALVHSADQKRLPIVPAAAIQRTRDGEQVYVVGDGNRIEQRTIETGAEVGQGYAVSSGLQQGEVVVVSGIQKVKPGMVVKPVKQSQAAPSGKSIAVDSAGAGAADSGSRADAADGDQDRDQDAGSGAGAGSDGAAGDAGQTQPSATGSGTQGDDAGSAGASDKTSGGKEDGQ